MSCSGKIPGPYSGTALTDARNKLDGKLKTYVTQHDLARKAPGVAAKPTQRGVMKLDEADKDLFAALAKEREQRSAERTSPLAPPYVFCHRLFWSQQLLC